MRMATKRHKNTRKGNTEEMGLPTGPACSVFVSSRAFWWRFSEFAIRASDSMNHGHEEAQKITETE